MRISGTIMIIGGLLCLSIGIYWSACFRDGLQPGVISSTGFQAITRTVTDGIYSIFFAVVMVVSGIIIIVKRRRDET